MIQQALPLFDNIDSLSATAPVSYANADDYRLAYEFLISYRGNTETFKAYRRELEKLLQWCWLIKKVSVLSLSSLDFEAFIEFCQKPPLQWIGLKHVPRFYEKDGRRQANAEWRPFVAKVSKALSQQGQQATIEQYQLSSKAVHALFSVCSSFYNFLMQHGATDKNPVLQIRQKSKFFRKQQQKAVIRRLSELQWSYVIETAEIMAAEDPTQHERTLFMMSALYGMYLRISELAASNRWTPQMGDFARDRDGLWWFTTVGKGNKERIISVSDAMLDSLKRYRKSLGLTSLPSPGELYPLIPKLNSQQAISSTRHIREIVQNCFDRSMERLRQDGFHDEAEQLMQATVHWLRHTGISDDIKVRPREHVRDDAGHSSSSITDKYIDIELRERHASAKKKIINPDD